MTKNNLQSHVLIVTFSRGENLMISKIRKIHINIPYTLAFVITLIVVSNLFSWALNHDYICIITGKSMNPTIQCHGLCFVNHYYSDIKRGDIVIVDKETEPKNLIKRVTGVPGDHVKFSYGDYYLNDEKNPDIYSEGVPYSFGPHSDYYIEDDMYFVMADNRIISYDSRAFGPVRKDEIIGKVVFFID